MRNVTLKELKKNLTKTGNEFFDMKDVMESNTLRFKGVKKRWAYDRNDTWSEAMIEEMIFQWSIIMIGVYNYDLESGFSGMTVDEVELMDEADLVKLSREFGELMVNTILQGLAVKIQVGDLPFDGVYGRENLARSSRRMWTTKVTIKPTLTRNMDKIGYLSLVT